MKYILTQSIKISMARFMFQVSVAVLRAPNMGLPSAPLSGDPHTVCDSQFLIGNLYEPGHYS